jgi:hypothetical protein
LRKLFIRGYSGEYVQNKEADMPGMPKFIFVSELIGDPNVKTASTFISYKTWNTKDNWMAEIIDNGNDFFHFHQGQRDKGHKDGIINYLAPDGSEWQGRIKDYVFTLYPKDKEGQGKTAKQIAYMSWDGRGYSSSFAEWFTD